MLFLNIIAESLSTLEDYKFISLILLYFFFNYCSYLVNMTGKKTKEEAQAAAVRFGVLFVYSTALFFLAFMFLCLVGFISES